MTIAVCAQEMIIRSYEDRGILTTMIITCLALAPGNHNEEAVTRGHLSPVGDDVKHPPPTDSPTVDMEHIVNEQPLV